MFALHVLKSLSLSLTRSGHVRPPRHVLLQNASEREREGGREGGEGGREGREIKREREETVKITERINSEDEAQEREKSFRMAEKESKQGVFNKDVRLLIHVQ